MSELSPTEEPSRDAPVDSAPIGSAVDREKPTPKSRSLRRRIKRAIKAPFVAAFRWTAPWLIIFWSWLCWKTCRVEDSLTDTVNRVLDVHGRCIGVLWHQEVLTVARAYRALRPHTLANTKDVGAIITKTLERSGFVVFRRRTIGKQGSAFTLRAMIEHMESSERVLYGITVDGSHGPRFQFKPGAVKIAKTCGAPTWLLGVQFSRRIELPTWDRSVFPLPFGRIQMNAIGPFWIDPEGDRQDQRAFREHIERELLELHVWQRTRLDGHPPRGPKSGLPEDFEPRWTEARQGLPRTEYDLDPENLPPWAPAAGS